MKLPWYGYEGATHYIWVFTKESAGIEATASSLEDAKELRLEALKQEPSAVVVIAPADGPNLLRMQFDDNIDELLKLIEEYNTKFELQTPTTPNSQPCNVERTHNDYQHSCSSCCQDHHQHQRQG